MDKSVDIYNETYPFTNLDGDISDSISKLKGFILHQYLSVLHLCYLLVHL